MGGDLDYCMACNVTMTDEWGYCKKCGLPVLRIDATGLTNREVTDIFIQMLQIYSERILPSYAKIIPALHNNSADFSDTVNLLMKIKRVIESESEQKASLEYLNERYPDLAALLASKWTR